MFVLMAKEPGNSGHYVNLKRADLDTALTAMARLLQLGWVVCMYRNPSC